MAYFLKEIIPLPKVLLEGTSSPKTTMETTRKLIFVKQKLDPLKMNSSSFPAGFVNIVSKEISDISLLEYGQASRYEEFLSDWSDSMQRVIIIDLLECLAPARHLLQHRLTLRVWCDMGIAIGVAGKLGRHGWKKSGISGGRW